VLAKLEDVMELKIGRDTLLAISAVAWADGSIDPREAAALRHAATQLLVQGEDLVSVERSLSSRVTLEEVETVRMNRLTRLFTYAAACWMAEVDGAESTAEGDVLKLLGDRLGLSAVARDRAHNAVRGIAERSQPGAFDLLALRSRLSAGLSQIGDE
jgi:tellurite resistance protein